MSLEDAITYKSPFKHIKDTVKPERDKNRRDVRRLNWWKYGEIAPKMRKEISQNTTYLPAKTDWLPNNSTTIIASADFYVLGVLTSKVHRQWVKAQSSTLEDRTRYTHNTCFETFPFPQLALTPQPPLPEVEGEKEEILGTKTSRKIKKQKKETLLPSPSGRGAGGEGIISKIRAAMQELHQYRSQQMESKQWGITKLYNEYFHEPASQLYKLHSKLDKLVMQAYGFSEDDTNSCCTNGSAFS